MPEIQTAMKASGANIQNAMGTTGHARGAGPDLGAGTGAALNARELASHGERGSEIVRDRGEKWT